MAQGDRWERAASKGALATSLAGVGMMAGGPAGAAIGGLIGLIVGDQPIVLQMDYIAIPAFELAVVMQGNKPSHQILLKEGEVLSQVQPTEAQETAEVLTSAPKKKKRKLNSWQKFLKTFSYRKRRKSETPAEYGRARMKAASKAFKRGKK